MKITQLSIKNFKSVEELVIRDIEDVLILVGRNNAGKSVMLDAIRAVSGDYAISEADFQITQPVSRTLHKFFIRNSPSQRKSRESIPFITFCQSGRAVMADRCSK